MLNWQNRAKNVQSCSIDWLWISHVLHALTRCFPTCPAISPPKSRGGRSPHCETLQGSSSASPDASGLACWHASMAIWAIALDQLGLGCQTVEMELHRQFPLGIWDRLSLKIGDPKSNVIIVPTKKCYFSILGLICLDFRRAWFYIAWQAWAQLRDA